MIEDLQGVDGLASMARDMWEHIVVDETVEVGHNDMALQMVLFLEVVEAMAVADSCQKAVVEQSPLKHPLVSIVGVGRFLKSEI